MAIGLRTSGTVLSLLLLCSRVEGQNTPVEGGAPSPHPPNDAPAAPAPAVAPLAPGVATANLNKVAKLYDGVQRAVGSEHVLLTLAAYAGERGHATQVTAGVAGMVTLPLLGMGGSHGLADWYPVLDTHDSSAAFAKFSEKVGDYVELVDNVNSLSANHPSFKVLFKAAVTMARQADDADAKEWQSARALKLCLEDIAKVLGHGSEVVADDALRWANEEEIAEGTPAKPIIDECTKVIKAVKNDVAKAKTAANQVGEGFQKLKDLLSKYRATATADRTLTTRHNLLFGPSIGIPMTSDPTDLLLAGGLLELGAGRFFRLAATGGIQFEYGDPGKTPGWFAGLALSGELGDDLFHLINGGLAGARKVAAQP